MNDLKIIVRKVNKSDSTFIFNLYNFCVKNKYFKTNRIISLKNHKIWFSSILKSKKTIIYLAYAKLTKKKIGYVRFDQHNQNWIISIANIKNYQQKGFGTKILKICINKLFKRSSKNEGNLVSFVKKNNFKSQKCFLKNNFMNKNSKKMFKNFNFSEKKYNLYVLKL